MMYSLQEKLLKLSNQVCYAFAAIILIRQLISLFSSTDHSHYYFLVNSIIILALVLLIPLKTRIIGALLLCIFFGLLLISQFLTILNYFNIYYHITITESIISSSFFNFFELGSITALYLASTLHRAPNKAKVDRGITLLKYSLILVPLFFGIFMLLTAKGEGRFLMIPFGIILIAVTLPLFFIRASRIGFIIMGIIIGITFLSQYWLWHYMSFNLETIKAITLSYLTMIPNLLPAISMYYYGQLGRIQDQLAE